MPHEYVNAQITYALIAFVKFMLFKLIFSVFCSLIVIIIIIINLTNYSLLQNEIQQKEEQKLICHDTYLWSINHLTPNGHFSGRTAPLTYRCCIF